MTTIDDFRDGERPDPVEQPRLRKRGVVRNPNDLKERVGTTVRVLNRGDDGPDGEEDRLYERGYLSTRDEESNLFRKFDSYPISEAILNALDREDVTRVFIVADETDGTTVYEFMLNQYIESSNRYVWERVVEGENVEDPQLCPPRSDALHTWEVESVRDILGRTDLD